MSAVTVDPFFDMERRLDVSYKSWTLSKIAGFYDPPDEKTGTGNTGTMFVPEGQRLWAWGGKIGCPSQVCLMDSICHNYPVGSIILNKQDGRYAIYDGRHRVQTIHAYLNDQFKVRDRKLSDLVEEDRETLVNTKIQVVILYNATDEQLSEIFERLNSGKQLKDRDHVWNWKVRPLIASTIKVMTDHACFTEVFGGVRFDSPTALRPDLPHWVGLLYGLKCKDAARMTTSWIRMSKYKDVNLDCPRVHTGLNALFDFYVRANELTPLSKNSKYKEYRRLGFINAFFLADWMKASTPEAKEAVVVKWLAVVKHVRTEAEGKDLVKVSGAQNLDGKKIEIILTKVNEWYESREE
jgi:hypothetical protein